MRRVQGSERIGQTLKSLDEARRRVRGVPERELPVREMLFRAGNECLHARQSGRLVLHCTKARHDCSFSFLFLDRAHLAVMANRRGASCPGRRVPWFASLKRHSDADSRFAVRDAKSSEAWSIFSIYG
jgi:hypothetical protein